MDDRAVSTVQTVLAETRWLPTPCPTEYLPALARDVLYALEQAGMGVVGLLPELESVSAQTCPQCSMPEPSEWCWQQSVSCPFGKPPRSKP